MGVRAANFLLQLCIWHFSCAEHLNLAPLKSKICRNAIGKEFVAAGDNALVVIREKPLGIAGHLPGWNTVATRPIVRPVDSPFQRADDSIVVHCREAVLP